MNAVTPLKSLLTLWRSNSLKFDDWNSKFHGNKRLKRVSWTCFPHVVLVPRGNGVNLSCLSKIRGQRWLWIYCVSLFGRDLPDRWPANTSPKTLLGNYQNISERGKRQFFSYAARKITKKTFKLQFCLLLPFSDKHRFPRTPQLHLKSWQKWLLTICRIP